MNRFDRPFWSILLSIAIIGTITWLAVFEHNYHPRIYRYSEEVIIFQVGDSELDFNHPQGAFSIWRRVGVGTQDCGRDSQEVYRGEHQER